MVGVPYEFKPKERLVLEDTAARFEAAFDGPTVGVKPTAEGTAFGLLWHAMRAVGWRKPWFAASHMHLPVEVFHQDTFSYTPRMEYRGDHGFADEKQGIRVWCSPEAARVLGREQLHKR